ncbi:MAG: HAMP domain-containing protein [Rhodospirillales bacterium]
MAEGSRLDEVHLERRAGQLRDRTFLGGVPLAGRAGWILILGFIVLAASAAVLWRADRLAGAMAEEHIQAAQFGTALARVEAGFAEAARRRAVFLQNRDARLVDTHNETVSGLADALGALAAAAPGAEARRHAAAAQEGFDQYVSLFEEAAEAESELGLADDEGLLGRLNTATETLRAAFQAAGVKDMEDRILALGQRARLAPAPLSDRDRGFIELEYEAVKNRAVRALKKAEDRETFDKLTAAHRDAAFAYINARTMAVGGAGRLRQALAAVRPGLDALHASAVKAGLRESGGFDARRNQLRLQTGGALAAIMAVYILAAWILMRSAARPLGRLAETAARLSHGDRGVAVPAQGNSDETGALARALDKWLDDLAEADHLRLELEDAGQRLAAARTAEAEAQRRAEQAEAHIQAQAQAQVQTGDAADEPLTAQPGAPAPAPAHAPAHTPAHAHRADDPGPIFTVSQELSQFTEYISAAARDVERTETLLRALDDAERLIGELADAVSAFRERTHALVFAASDPGEGDPAEVLAPRFEAVRAAVDRAEGAVEAVRATVDGVTGVAHGIAETASSQALDATRKLLARSEHLQAMLDDIMSKLNAAGGE